VSRHTTRFLRRNTVSANFCLIETSTGGAALILPVSKAFDRFQDVSHEVKRQHRLHSKIAIQHLR